jgi:hypothetical protein
MHARNDEGVMERNNVNDSQYVFMDASNDKGETKKICKRIGDTPL